MKNITTYLVEDSAVIRQSLINTLEELTDVRVIGFAEDEASAMTWLLAPANKPDLVIIDLFLKSGTGMGVLGRMNGQAHESTLVVLTNYATTEMRQRCFTLGATQVFDKSNDIEALILYCSRFSQGEYHPSTVPFSQ